jgi:hypothetical protein
MKPDHRLVVVIALCALAGAMVVLMARGTIPPLIPILP